VFLSTLLIGTAYASAFGAGGTPGWAPWALAVGLSGCMVGVMVMGAVRQGRLGRLGIPLAFVFVVLVGCFGLALAHPGTDPADPELWLGLPPRAAIILFGVGLLPLLAMPLAYALTFEEQTLRPEDVERIRSHRTRAAAETPAGASERPVAEAVR
jgi:MFS family permease